VWERLASKASQVPLVFRDTLAIRDKQVLGRKVLLAQPDQPVFKGQQDKRVIRA